MPENDKGDKKYSYKSSGVDIDKASDIINQLKDTLKSTYSDRVLSSLSSFSGLFQPDLKNYRDPVLTSSTDGVGTKILLAKKTDCFENIGQDAVAMIINDIICCGAKPLFFLDYIACGKLNEKRIKIIIESMARSCSYCDTVLIGGEIAEHPGTGKVDDIDIAGFAVGIVEKSNIIKTDLVREGDIIIGIASSGIHSNGFSLVRRIIVDKKVDLQKEYDWTKGKLLKDLLMTPTKLYFRIVDRMIKSKIEVHGIAHITGGGFYENINRIIPPDMDAYIQEGRWNIPAVFKFLQDMGNIDRDEMFRVFNMGIGMVMIMPPGQFSRVEDIVGELKEEVYNIGTVTAGSNRVIIKES
jgi:phosphoribosylformylglycinamidine cyclo-ligase